jgi:hypothetical protein
MNATIYNGWAYHVRHPRRPKQDFVCTDAAYVVKELLLVARDCDWPVYVELIDYRGTTALPITATLSELFSVDDGLRPWFSIDWKGNGCRLVSRQMLKGVKS